LIAEEKRKKRETSQILALKYFGRLGGIVGWARAVVRAVL
jgi:hypothetical protein